MDHDRIDQSVTLERSTSIRNAEAKHIEYAPVLITHFHAPGALVRFSQLNHAVGGPFGRVKPEPCLRAQLIVMEPPMINERRLRYRIKGRKAVHLPGCRRKHHSLSYRVEVLHLFGHDSMVQGQFLRRRLGGGRLGGRWLLFLGS